MSAEPALDVASLLARAQLALAWFLCGLIWVVQIVIYPLFARIGAEAFARYHEAYTRRITWVVGPAMLAELLLAAATVVRAPGSSVAWLGAGLVGVVWLSTACVQVPLHNRLSRADPASAERTTACARLVTTNWARTTAWTSRALLLSVVTA